MARVPGFLSAAPFAARRESRARSETDPMIDGKCPKCGSDEIVRNARVFGGENLVRDLSAQVFYGARAATKRLSPHICGNCGYTEFYAQDPQILLEASRRALPERFQERLDEAHRVLPRG